MLQSAIRREHLKQKSTPFLRRPEPCRIVRRSACRLGFLPDQWSPYPKSWAIFLTKSLVRSDIDVAWTFEDERHPMFILRHHGGTPPTAASFVQKVGERIFIITRMA